MSRAADLGAGPPPPRAFPGHPALYLRLSILMSAAIHAYLYAGMVVVEALVRSEDWIFGWKPVAVTLASAVFFAWYMYRMILRLDARIGRGSRWRLVTRVVKLPERQ